MPAERGPGRRRRDFPPLWTVPLLLIVAIGVLVFIGSTLGVLGLVGAAIAVSWLQVRTDAYVRRRERGETRPHVDPGSVG